MVFPYYELIVVKYKKETSKNHFRKMIQTIIQKEKRLNESLEINKDVKIIKYQFVILNVFFIKNCFKILFL